MKVSLNNIKVLNSRFIDESTLIKSNILEKLHIANINFIENELINLI
jgi:hypothetical protein